MTPGMQHRTGARVVEVVRESKRLKRRDRQRRTAAKRLVGREGQWFRWAEPWRGDGVIYEGVLHELGTDYAQGYAYMRYLKPPRRLAVVAVPADLLLPVEA